MGYLFIQLWPYVLGAFMIGLVVGWISCGRVNNEQF
jgi:hypothetical protein